MVVNSIPFLLFFIVVFSIYYLPIVKQTAKRQNLWLLFASYFFYGYADLRMIPLLLGATFVFYFVGIWLKSTMEKEEWRYASHITTLGVCLGVGLLLYFKYLGFFAESFGMLLNSIGINASWSTLNIVLPIGVSFFTFKLISYIVEIHRERIDPSRDMVEFALYVAFFPTILSGPIDRPNKFFPQLRKNHSLDYDMAVDGCRQILWGMFTKMCIADNLAVVTNSAWQNIDNSSSSTLIVCALLYPVQMYADFDGYSNMAIGVGKILGFKIARNFNHPFLARNIAEYWRNWHISLTGWLTDYVFSPLTISFRNWGNIGIIMAIIINFLIIGFWHGANWTFGFFGLYHGLLYIPLVLSGAFAKKKKLVPNGYGLPAISDFMKMCLTFCLVAVGLVFFRAETMEQAFEFITKASTDKLTMPAINSYEILYCSFAVLLLCSEWIVRTKEHPFQFSEVGLFRYKAVRWGVYLLTILLIITFTGKSQAFIYFQF